MAEPKAFRIAVLTLALLAVFLFAAAGAGAWDQHDCCSRGVCQICHLGHQGVEAPHADLKTLAPEPLGTLLIVNDVDFFLGPFTPRTPSRAPPSL
jgi:hypothetical protein